MSDNLRVHDGLIDSIQFFIPRHALLRWDTGPFLVYYSIFFSILLLQQNNGTAFSFEYESTSSTEEATSEKALLLLSLILIPIGLFLHIALFLLAQTYPSVQVWIGNHLVRSASALTVQKVIVALIKAAANVGNDKVVAMDTTVRRYPRPPFHVVDMKIASAVSPSSEASNATFLLGRVDFQKVKYDLLSVSGQLELQRVSYPSAGKLDSFLKWTGMGLQHSDSGNKESVDAVKAAQEHWGCNEYDIPLPQFLDLYLSHLTAPFFVFQVLCLFLWSLDDYWIYSAFTLLMLLFFEGMMCKQRQNSLLMLRNMRRPPVPLLVFRYGQWTVLESDLIVPGDVISLTTTPLSRRRRGQSSDGSGEGESGGEGLTVPCDALLLKGSCVVNEAMLTGESVPQMKEPPGGDKVGTCGQLDIGSDSNISPDWKRHLVLSGTSLVIHNGDSGSPSPNPNRSPNLSPPDGGCVCLVLRTGFGSTQGGLMRKILFARERIAGQQGSGGGAGETALFIGLLVLMALLAAGWVLLQGLKDERRNTFRLSLHCVMVVTSVVPPELPMELSLAVTNSLAALSRVLVYCTEPFRIALAGKIDVCCFDKTGTLTQDQMLLKGVVGGLSADRMGPGSGSGSDSAAGVEVYPEEQTDGREPAVQVMEPEGFADVVLAIMGCCHDLIPPSRGQAQLLGDPLEVATLTASGFRFETPSPVGGGGGGGGPGSGGSNICSLLHEGRDMRLTVLHRLPFSSSLKRMTTVVQQASDGGLWAFSKGAPEVLRAHMDPKSVPPNFQATAFYHMSRGKRVLAIAYKRLRLSGLKKGDPASAVSQAVRAQLPRGEVEKDLVFAGFLVFDCDLKPDSKSVVKELKAAQLAVVMITGDSVFTAAEVARKLGIVKAPSAAAAGKAKDRDSAREDKDKPGCVLILHCKSNANQSHEGPVLWRSGEVDGDSPEEHSQDRAFLSDRTSIQALSVRHSLCVTGPALSALEKEAGQGYAALLRALAPFVSVFARVSPAQKELILLALNDAGLVTLMCGDGTNDVGALKAAHVGVSIVNDPSFERRIDASSKKDKSGSGKTSSSTNKDRMARALSELQEQEQDPTLVKLGDASIASPFTCRRTSVDSVLSVIRQGRCTLVTTIQVYKILALNCLVSAYMMSALYLRGLKQGDTQMTASGLVVAALFFLLSQAKPLQALSARRPASSVFAPSVALSILASSSSILADGRFQPNLINSAVFLLSAVMQVNNFVVNYRGNPFTQGLTENLPLLRTVQGLYGGLLLAVGGGLEPLNDLLQLAPFPGKEFQAQLLAVLLLNCAATWAMEKFCQTFEK